MENARQNSIRLSYWEFKIDKAIQEVEDKESSQESSVGLFSEIIFII